MQVVNHTKLFAVNARLLTIVNDQGNIHIRHRERRMCGIGEKEEEYEEPEIQRVPERHALGRDESGVGKCAYFRLYTFQ